VLDRVGVVRANLLKKPLEVICRCHFLAPDAARNSGGAPHTGDARFPAMVIAVASRGNVAVPRERCLHRLLSFLMSPWVQ
jgi:hypothetical protein